MLVFKINVSVKRNHSGYWFVSFICDPYSWKCKKNFTV